MLLLELFPWRSSALVRQLLCFLSASDVRRLCASHRAVLERVLPVLREHQRSVGRLALAIWIAQRLRVDFQARYQVLETQQVARSQSLDPRVPPRIVSYWSERGQVEGGRVTLKPSALPLVYASGFTAHFAVDPSEKPMLTNVVQTQRRIYTMVTVKLLKHQEAEFASSSTRTDDSEEDGSESAIVLRQHSYVKEFGEWTAPTAPEKCQFSLQGDAPCRFDLLSRDGSVVLELDVPSGTDSLVDYYLVKKVAVSIHMAELLQRFFQSIRPPRPLPTPTMHLRAECVISWQPGVLEFYPTPDSRQRRCLKGHVTISSGVGSGVVRELAIVAQHIERSRLERYAASIDSYTRIERG